MHEGTREFKNRQGLAWKMKYFEPEKTVEKEFGFVTDIERQAAEAVAQAFKEERQWLEEQLRCVEPRMRGDVTKEKIRKRGLTITIQRLADGGTKKSLCQHGIPVGKPFILKALRQ